MITPLMLISEVCEKNQKDFSFFLQRFCGFVILKPSRDRAHLLGRPTGLKDLLYMLNPIITPTKGGPHVLCKDDQNLSVGAPVHFLTRQSWPTSYLILARK